MVSMEIRNLPTENVSKASRSRNWGLPRPKTPISFTVTSGTKSLQRDARISEQLLSGVPQNSSLESDLLLLDLIIRRNKNQHRNQRFFKDICLLRSCLRRIKSIRQDLDSVSGEAFHGKDSDHVRRRLQRETNLRGQKEVLEEHAREVLVPLCYVSFSALVNDSQFANAGVVLVALLSSIASGQHGVGLPKKVQVDTPEPSDSINAIDSISVAVRSTRMTGDDHGQVIDRLYSSDQGTVSKMHSTTLDDRDEDAGMPIDRSEVEFPPDRQDYQNDNLPIGSTEYHAAETPSRPGEAPRTKKKQKKRSDAIDDLFSSLM